MKRQKEPALTAKQTRCRVAQGEEAPSNHGHNMCATHTGEKKSMLAALLLHDCLWAELSPQKVQRYCEAALQDGMHAYPDLEILAKLGTDGSHPGHVWRDLKNMPDPLHSSLYTARVPMKVPAGRSTMADLDILAPHLVLNALYHGHRGQFNEKMLGGGPENVATFWESQVDHPMFANHPMHTRTGASFSTHGIPIAIHRDEVPVLHPGKQWCKMVECISWSSCLCRGPVNLVNIVIAFIFSLMYVRLPGLCTHDAIWKVVCWSLTACYEGKFPSEDPSARPYTEGINARRAGQWLADGYFLVLWLLRSDLDYMKSAFRGADYGGNQAPCNSCAATGDDECPWTDCRDDAVWMNKIYSPSEHARLSPLRHRIFRSVPGSSITIYLADILHTKHIGTDQPYYGSVIRYLTHSLINDGINPDANLQTLWQDIANLYKKFGAKDRSTTMRHTMALPQGAKLPHLKGKGGTIKQFGPVLEHIFLKYMQAGNVLHALTTRGLRMSVRIDEILAENKHTYRLPPDEAKEFRKCCFDFCKVECALIKKFHRSDPAIPLFHYTIKSQGLMHLGVVAGYINPSMGSCYQGETLMRTAKRVVASSANGSAPLVAANNAIEKYCYAVSFDLQMAAIKMLV